MELSNSLVVLDLETTGTWVEKDKIVEIALVKIHPDGTKEEYLKKVNPEIPIPPFVAQLTGISDEDVRDAPLFKNIAQEVLDFIGSSDFAGFNVFRFDLPVLEREFYEAGLKLEWQKMKVYDAQKVYHINEKRDLTAAYQFYCNKELDNAHSAMVDTKATLAIIESQIEKYGEGNKSIDVLEQYEYKSTAEFFDDERKFRWWNGKLYMMFGKYARKYSLQEVVQKDRGYLTWILSADFSEDIKTLIDNALQGHFPKPASNDQIELF